MTSRLRTARHRLVAKVAEACIAAFGRLPTDVGLRVGAWLGRIFAFAVPRRWEIGLVNLRIAFPEWSEAHRRRVLRAAFENVGRCLYEAASLRRVPPEVVHARVRLEGIEHLEAAQRASRRGGVLVLTGHFGNWELLGSAMAQRGLPLTVVHRARNNPFLDEVVRRWREASGLALLDRGSAARGALRALSEGRIVAMPLDQNTHRREGIFVPFFHRLACSRHAPVRIAERTGAPIIPAFIFREGSGPRHVVRVGPAIPLVPPGEDPAAALRENVRRLNAAVEDAVRAAPDHWTWWHRRWKTQPPGEARPYRSKHARGPLGSFLLGRVRA